MNATSRIIAGLAVAAACLPAFAQDAVAPAASRPDAVATTPEKAQAAQDKAIKRADTATVVRTGPTAADRTRMAADNAEARVDRMTDRADRATDRMTDRDGTTLAGNDGSRTSRNTTLAPRADRN